MVDTEITPALKDAIETVIRQELGRFGIAQVEAIGTEDHDGDPVIRVLVHYSHADAEPDPKVASETITKLNDRLFELKEPRFAYISHDVPEVVRRRRGRP
ncbi:hypothetical protein ASG40_17910 [Methylobacterium sp. Leaf399]|uniref:hypothetical protein n=1 Tax=Methylobacterium sp. Leaf399 TaxID=1736364 RepID=UPI0006F8C917|nr:hypothetical protein [Methylobacterium sp. Leaf399]KQT16570.1 hypothetical protein ASG40_17910 [Methylobacterium sp. Leaf399]